MINETSPESPSRRRAALGPVALIAGAVVTTTLAVVIAAAWRPSRASDTPDLAQQATDFLREKKPDPLSGPLQALLADTTQKRTPTEPHPLLNHPAPEFTLPGVDGKPVSSSDLWARGPVVLVFYYGYTCNHCVSQLFDLNEDLRYFTELGASVVTISPDTAEHTTKQYAKYGAFGFSVLSDKDRSIASRYGVYRPAVGDLRDWQAHGTFLIGRDGRVRWANTGAEPFTGNPTLLAEIARLENRFPEPQTKDTGVTPFTNTAKPGR